MTDEGCGGALGACVAVALETDESATPQEKGAPNTEINMYRTSGARRGALGTSSPRETESRLKRRAIAHATARRALVTPSGPEAHIELHGARKVAQSDELRAGGIYRRLLRRRRMRRAAAAVGRSTAQSCRLL